MGTMHGLVTSGGPAGAPRHEGRVVQAANPDRPGRRLLLEMAFQTKALVSLGQQLGVDRPMDGVAGRATFSNRLVLEHKWSLLGGMAFGAHLGLRSQRRSSTFLGWTFVRIVAIAATDSAFQHRVMVGKAELAPLIEVALETGFG